MNKIIPKENWIDYTKVIACTLVVLGHIFMEILDANIIQKSIVADWFIQTIYLFHVPLFFICIGYLYQKSNKDNSFSEWDKNIKNKSLSLGVPYITFTIITIVIQTLFSSSINGKPANFFLYPNKVLKLKKGTKI